MTGGAGILHAEETMLHRILSHKNRLGFDTEDEAAYLSLMMVVAAADTVRIHAFVTNCMLIVDRVKCLQCHFLKP